MKKEITSTRNKKIIIHVAIYLISITGLVAVLRPDLFWSHKEQDNKELAIITSVKQPDFDIPIASEKNLVPFEDGIYQINSQESGVGWSISTQSGEMRGIFSGVVGVLLIEDSAITSAEVRVDPSSFRVLGEDNRVRNAVLEKIFMVKDFPEIKVMLNGARGPREMDGLHDMGATFSFQGKDLSVAFAGSISQESPQSLVVDTYTPLKFEDLGIDISVFDEYDIKGEIALDSYLVFDLK